MSCQQTALYAKVVQHTLADSPHVKFLGNMVSLRAPRGYHSPQHSPRQLNEQISDLKIELARRDADVEYLEGQLAEAVAANRPRVRPHADWSPDEVSWSPLDRQQQLLC